VAVRFQLRRGKAAFWTDQNPVLRDGEPGYEKDTKRLKIGDGVTFWRDLPYFGGDLSDLPDDSALAIHINSPTPHPAYDDAPSLALIYQNAKV
jgi:hypothetical protein